MESNDLQAMIQGADFTGPIATNAIQVAQTLAPKAAEGLLKVLSHWFALKIDARVAIAERAPALVRATTASQVALTMAASKNVADRLATPSSETIDEATQIYTARALGKDLNLLNVASNAVSELSRVANQTAVTPESESTITLDWLNSFASEAEKMSSEYMQKLFGKILAGEICKPRSFSIKTLRTVSEMDQEAAEFFASCCSTVIKVIGRSNNVESTFFIDLDNDKSSQPLKYNDFVETGLFRILPDGTDLWKYIHRIRDLDESARIDEDAFELSFQNRRWGIKVKLEAPKNNIFYPDDAPSLMGLTLTKTGLELLPIISIDENPETLEKFRTALAKNHATLIER
ncbi:DUF2806 domain-containing protein [Delftia acidovorans]|uniref:DUF2806 domain-containing protein n=1 Tax=Delftia acidovorans TaxID=80866 RepID=A0AAJ2VDQ4_DELAC|nr:DUF2806 domain-containing protein [Delftia acidovorans]MDX4957827.1 DUF2806 domain-containing protein [Delftia acidovorans]